MEDLKMVLHMREGRALVGVQQKDCDPVLEPVQAGTLAEVLAAVPGLVERARERWTARPRNPKHEGLPAPPPAPLPIRREPAAAPTREQTRRLF